MSERINIKKMSSKDIEKRTKGVINTGSQSLSEYENKRIYAIQSTKDKIEDIKETMLGKKGGKKLEVGNLGRTTKQLETLKALEENLVSLEKRKKENKENKQSREENETERDKEKVLKKQSETKKSEPITKLENKKTPSEDESTNLESPNVDLDSISLSLDDVSSEGDNNDSENEGELDSILGDLFDDSIKDDKNIQVDGIENENEDSIPILENDAIEALEDFSENDQKGKNDEIFDNVYSDEDIEKFEEDWKDIENKKRIKINDKYIEKLSKRTERGGDELGRKFSTEDVLNDNGEIIKKSERTVILENLKKAQEKKAKRKAKKQEKKKKGSFFKRLFRGLFVK